MSTAKKHYSAAQKKILLEFIEQNPSLVTLKLSNQYTSSDIKSKWIEVTETLNATPGVSKTWKEWRKSWSDIKCRTKKKQAENNKSCVLTGGGPSSHQETDPIEDRILNVIGGTTMIMGNTNVVEAGINFEPEGNCNKTQTSDCYIFEFDKENLPEIDETAVVCTDALPLVCPIKDTPASTASRKSTKTVLPPKKVVHQPTPKKNNLKASVEASNNLITLSEKKNEMKRKYYEEKLNILREDVVTKKRIAAALEKIGDSLTR